ncbi:hypothetical protein [Flavobacterium sp. LS1R10]|uniref:hypothetical protein n=1 Tax=Flavobacterium sp. LS1R10 TaxID=2497482 RepID=UPI000F81FD20|nr:hypothetical protein [Flavobacterium sp. LS1R10]RTY76708.1 hypothetical protein EKL96_04265 [Flavobacterium sp. LS1R10]
MGQILEGICTKCDYSANLLFGGNRINNKEQCPVPALNLETDQIESVNYILHQNNPNYLFYTNKNLKGINKEKLVYRNFDLELHPSNNFCPKCKNLSLEFISKYLTD